MKYYYWANAIIGVNPAANCVLFTTEENTVIPTITMTVTGATLEPVDGEDTVEIGGIKPLKFALTGSVTNGTGSPIAVEPDSATFEVAATNAEENAAVALNTRTYVDAYGVLHVQKTGLTAGDIITVTAKSTYINPSGATTDYTATAELTVTAATSVGAKECAVSAKPFIEYTDTTEPASASE